MNLGALYRLICQMRVIVNLNLTDCRQRHLLLPQPCLVNSRLLHMHRTLRPSRRVQESRHSDHLSVASIVETFQLAHKVTDR